MLDKEKELKRRLADLDELHKEKKGTIARLVILSILCLLSVAVLITSIILSKKNTALVLIIPISISVGYIIIQAIELKSINEEMKKTNASIMTLLDWIREEIFKKAMEQLENTVKSIQEKARQRREELEKAEKEKKKTATKKTTKKTQSKKTTKKSK